MQDSWTARALAEEFLKTIPAMGRVMTRYMRDSGEEETTIMQVGVLFHLQQQPITVSELAKKRHVSLQAASALVQALVEKGWVTRTPDPQDRRQSRLQLTPEGQERAHNTTRQITDYFSEFLRELSAEEIAAASIFLPALNRMLVAKMSPEAVKNEQPETTTEE